MRRILFLIVCTASIAGAQPRQLSWPSINVAAHIDADGVLHVQERQVFRFTGDWNGGERRFNVPFGQRFEFDSIVRIDDAGVRHRLVEGSLNAVDDFGWADGRVLRWRSRLPTDAPFDNTLLTYELAFRYAYILEPAGNDTYVLDHDFAFANRDGVIEHFSVDLTIDPAWRTPVGFTGRFEEDNLLPGRRYVVHVPLVRVAATAPAGVLTGAPFSVRALLAAALLIGVVGLFMRLMSHDRQLGRFAPLLPPHEVTRDFLDQEVFARLPEVVGTAWDDSTSQAEVAATLARLVQEKKLSSRVETKKVLFFGSHVLHLDLEVPRSQLKGHERTLVDALFESHSNHTSTDAVRKRYSKTGFDPAAIIKDALKRESSRLAPSRKPKKASKLPTLAMIGVAIVLLVFATVNRGADGVVSIPVLLASLPLYGIAMIAASVWRTRVHHQTAPAVFLFGSVAILVLLFTALVLGEQIYPLGTFAVAGLTVWVFALINSVFNRARLALSAERVALRKRLLAARTYFQHELEKPNPSFSDAAYPYLLAFGLGTHVDRWFKAFGGESSGVVVHSSGSSVGGGMSSGGGNSSFGGFGGGGGFSGGGGGAAFGAAIGGMAASVPSPSSSSSGGGGGGGGGGSSGGGGGGGW